MEWCERREGWTSRPRRGNKWMPNGSTESANGRQEKPGEEINK